MDPTPFIQSTVSLPGPTKNATGRSRPLHTCGVVALTVAHKIYSKAQNLHGPIGFLTQKLATLATPVLYIIQYQWLVILSFTDDQILAIEDTFETLFPPLSYVFDKIDALVHFSETFPDKLDNVAEKLLMVMYQVPFLNWSLAHFVMTLNFFITTLTDWGIHDEKNTMIHVNGTEQPSDANPYESRSFVGSGGAGHGGGESMDKEVVQEEKKRKGYVYKDIKEVEKKKVQKTYKEVLEMGTKKEDITSYKEVLLNGAKKEENVITKKELEIEKKEKEDNEMSKYVILNKTNEFTKGGPILSLFPGGWPMNKL